MIQDFTNWMLLEHFGTGEETFTELLSTYSQKGSNLDIWGPPAWGEIEEATGKVTYTAKLDYTKNGIEDIYFNVVKISLTVSCRIYRDKDDDDGELKEFDIEFDSANMKNCKVEIQGGLPFYVENLTIDLKNAEDLDGEVDISKAEIVMAVGSSRE